MSAFGAILLCHVAVARGAEPPLSAEEMELVGKLRLTTAFTPDPTNRLSGNAAAVALGARLFVDPALSGSGTRACASCHDPAKNFGDGLRHPEGAEGVMRNAPSIAGLAGSEWFFWDGRADTLWGQALAVLENPREMGGDRRKIADYLRSDASYRTALTALAGEDALADANRLFVMAGKCLAAFVETIRFTDTRFDAFVDEIGRHAASRLLTDQELRGLKLFIGPGNCVLCHNGPRLSDGLFHNLGLSPQKTRATLDPGRYAAGRLLDGFEFNGASVFSDDRETGELRLRTVALDNSSYSAFKTPSLRNVRRNAPYMHDGRYDTLHQVVTFYSTLDNQANDHHREGAVAPLDLTGSEISDLVAFLAAIDSELEVGRVPGDASRSRADR